MLFDGGDGERMFFGKSTIIRLARTASVTELNCNTLNAESS